MKKGLKAAEKKVAKIKNVVARSRADMKMDKKFGLKEGSKADVKEDRKMRVANFQYGKGKKEKY